MKEKLYVSTKALELKGKEYFRGLEASDFGLNTDERIDGLYVSQDDMWNISLSIDPYGDDENEFIDVNDLFEDEEDER